MNDLENMSTVPQTDLPAAAEAEVEAEVAQTFTPFKRLPPELRINIWEEAKAAPQILHVIEHKLDWGNDEERLFITSSNDLNLPALLQTNRESRHIALRDYIFMPHGDAKTIVDLSSDVLYFNCHLTFHNFITEMKKRLDQPREGTITDDERILNYTKFESNLCHLVIGDCYSDIDEMDLGICRWFKGLKSVTYHANLIDDDHPEKDTREIWKELWLGNSEPSLVFISSCNLAKMMHGDMKWWQAEMEKAKREDEKVAEQAEEVVVADV